jgi:hypothetical protein
MIKYLRFIMLLILAQASFAVNAQDTTLMKSRWMDNSPTKDNSNRSFIQKEAEFPGGKVALDSFITDKVYEMYEQDQVIAAGTITLKYTIDTAGNVAHVEVLESLEPEMDSLCIAIIRSMPKWKPGHVASGKLKDSSFVLPFTFTLFNKE